MAELQDARAVPSIAGLLPEGYSGSCDMGELAAGALAGAGDAGVDALVVASRNQREGVRKRAICSLTRVQNPRAIGALVGALGEPYDYPRCGDKPLRDAALEALVGIGAPAIEPLKEAATANSGGTRERALAALVKLNGSQSIPMLSDMLAKGGPEQQVAAAKALATSGDQGLEVLLGAVQSPRSRRAALTALGGTKSSRAVPPLIQALRSGGSEDAEQAKRSLAGLGAVSAPDLIDLLDSPSFAPVVYDIFMRGHMPSEGGASLVAAHQKSVGRKHLEIARILSDIGERRADDGLWSDVRRGDLRVAVSLDSFLIRTGSPEAEGILIRALDAYGTGDMALTLLNSGNDKLEKAATNWASRHGYKVNRSNMPNFGPRWGGR